jgi:hypothetical protein
MKMKMSSFLLVNEIKRTEQVSKYENQISGKFYVGPSKNVVYVDLFLL